jgi:hypothetical protein
MTGNQTGTETATMTESGAPNATAGQQVQNTTG